MRVWVANLREHSPGSVDMRNVAVQSPGVVGPLALIGWDPDVAIATAGEFVLLLWRRRIVRVGVGWTKRAFSAIAAGSKPDSKVVFLTALAPGCDVSTPPEVRKDIADLLKTYETQLACAAIVFEGNGFGMTIVRSVITAINLTSRTRFPNGVFSRVDSALTWIAPHARDHDIQFEPPRIIAAIDRLRAL